MFVAAVFAELVDRFFDHPDAPAFSSVAAGWAVAQYLEGLSSNHLGAPVLTVDIEWDVVRHCGMVSEEKPGRHCCYRGVDTWNWTCVVLKTWLHIICFLIKVVLLAWEYDSRSTTQSNQLWHRNSNGLYLRADHS